MVGVLIGEGHFGGDGKQPQITLRMHVRHEALFRWLVRRFPRTRLYGPYGHGGRRYYQWMARGAALVEDVLPVVEDVLTDDVDAHVAREMRDMRHSTPTSSPVMSDDGALAALQARAGELSSSQLGQLAALLEMLEADEHAPTTVRAAARPLDVHLADSLVALELAAVRDARRIADLGAGAGFPGLALAVALPDAEVALVESRGASASSSSAPARGPGSPTRAWCARASRSGARALVATTSSSRGRWRLPVVLRVRRAAAASGRCRSWTGVAGAWPRRRRRRRGPRRSSGCGGRRSSRAPICWRAWRTPAPLPEGQRHAGRFPRRVGVARKRPLGRP